MYIFMGAAKGCFCLTLYSGRDIRKGRFFEIYVHFAKVIFIKTPLFNYL